ncbi:hypothetical protein EHV15_31765 [Paenibacillus oralis]|uniref:LamG-like jellyroll fold domain-containing protein n=1 Tax=Paenibacillus oralis TaxID=2490856 RepID=A0A3P3UBE4_9BACL|nr:LamG-like jellyroll fold domain-containing protein [Paenibacillus oralis]RRJ66996.1 hypothetical protein EHV15_31765 [Paenibacillus oralis]
MNKQKLIVLCSVVAFLSQFLFNGLSFAESNNIDKQGKYFDGTSQISLDNLPINATAGAKTTVEFWMYWDGGNYEMPFSWSSWYDLYLADGYFGFNTFEGNMIGTPAEGLKQKWVHVAAIFYNGVPDPTNNELYINGVKQDLHALGPKPGSRTVFPSAFISGFADEGYKFKGKIANLRIWNKTLNAKEIKENMQKTLLLGKQDGLVGTWELIDEPQIFKNFDGSDQISLNNLPINTSAGAKTTVEFWMYWDGGNYEMPFSWGSWYDLYLADGYFGFNTYEGNMIGTPAEGLKQKWVHVAAIFYNGVPGPTHNELYINGVKQDLHALGPTPGARSVFPSAFISGFADEGYKFKGKIANLRIWNKALNAKEIKENMQKTLVVGEQDELVGAWELIEEPQIFKKFNGSNQISLNNLLINSAAGAKTTVDFWMYWEGGNYEMPFSWNSWYDLYLADGYFGFNTYEGNMIGAPAEELKQKWVHVAAVFYNGVPDSINNELYINGVKQKLYASGPAPGARSVFSSANISGFADEGYKFKGKIAHLRIWNKALSEDEVRSYMYQPMSVNHASDLVGVWHINDDPSGSIEYIYDASGRIKSIKLPSGQEYQYRYDANGNLIDIVGL